MTKDQQEEFDFTVGTLDRVLSKLIIYSNEVDKSWNVQTLKRKINETLSYNL